MSFFLLEDHHIYMYVYMYALLQVQSVCFYKLSDSALFKIKLHSLTTARKAFVWGWWIHKVCRAQLEGWSQAFHVATACVDGAETPWLHVTLLYEFPSTWAFGLIHHEIQDSTEARILSLTSIVTAHQDFLGLASLIMSWFPEYDAQV